MIRIATSHEATHALGVELGAAAAPGTVLALTGDLGMGKTVLAKGVGAGLGVRGVVTSPTFIIVAAHEGGRLPFWHADLYRLADGSELEQLGLDELTESDGVAVIEWAERFPEVLPGDHVAIEITEQGDGRRIQLVAHGPRSAALIERLDG